MTAARPAPDVLAYTLEEARRVLESAGFAVLVTETRPPGRGVPEGTPRVVRQRQEDQRVLLVVARERFARSSSPPAAEP